MTAPQSGAGVIERIGQDRKRSILIVTALTLFALALRLWGIGWMLPYRIVQDEGVFLTHVELLRGDPVLPRHDIWQGRYPDLVPYIGCTLLRNPATPSGDHLSDHLRAAGRDALVLRCIVALISVLIVPATYVLARRFLSEGPALLAAGLASTDVFYLWLSQQARPHGSAAALSACAVLASLWLYRRGSVGTYVIAGVAHGLAVGAVQFGIATFPTLLVAHYLRTRGAPWRAHLRLLFGLVPFVGAVCAFYPFMFEGSGLEALSLAPTESDEPDPARRRFLGEVNFLHTLSPGLGFPKLVNGAWQFQTLLLCLTTVALFLWSMRPLALVRSRDSADHQPHASAARARRTVSPELIIVLTFVLVLVFGLSIYRRAEHRYILPLLPYLSCASAVAAYRMSRALLNAVSIRTGVERAVHVAAWSAFLVQAAWATKSASIRAATNTQQLAANWIAAHCEPGVDRIAIFPTLDLPLARDSASIAGLPYSAALGIHPWLAYQAGLPPDALAASRYSLVSFDMDGRDPAVLEAIRKQPIAFVKGYDADYVVAEIYDPTRDRPVLIRVLEGIRSQGTLVASFSPRSDVESVEEYLARDFIEDAPRLDHWLLNLTSFVRLGRRIEIYKMRPS